MPFSIMLNSIMLFLNRTAELGRLDALRNRPEGGLAVVFGRRRIGKTRLLVEWCRRHQGLYAVADQSAPGMQRRYLAEAVATRFPGFADVDYRDWRSLFTRFAVEARAAHWHGPLVLDELPYWVAGSPELPSVLQRWIDHDAREAGLVVAIAGSSQRMMQGLALDRGAPLYGRAHALFEVGPLAPTWIPKAWATRLTPSETVDIYAAWGGVPRYWELASVHGRDTPLTVDRLVLDPGGPLHREPDRLLLEEVPSALEVRPVLDAVGAGAHRVSEMAGRLGRPATSLARPLDRLVELGLVTRDVPFGEPPRGSRRSLYRISDPFTRLWFQVVAPNRGLLVSGTPAQRRRLLTRFWPRIVGEAWEQLTRERTPWLDHPLLGPAGTWAPAQRWWQGSAPEWDLVAEDATGTRLLLGESRSTASRLKEDVAEVGGRTLPDLPAKYRRHTIVRAIFVPETQRQTRIGDVIVVSLRHLL